jgi:hypothetical protein
LRHPSPDRCGDRCDLLAQYLYGQRLELFVESQLDDAMDR